VEIGTHFETVKIKLNIFAVWVGTTINCFELIFGFLMKLWFQKNRSAPWNQL
jgi:hypothetical protein